MLQFPYEDEKKVTPPNPGATSESSAPVSLITTSTNSAPTFFKNQFKRDPNLVDHFDISVKRMKEGIARNKFNHVRTACRWQRQEWGGAAAEGSWVCPECDVTNTKDEYKCPCCEYVNRDMPPLTSNKKEETKSKGLPLMFGRSSTTSCLCERVETWKLDQCAECKKNLGSTRLAEETLEAEKVKLEDHRRLLDILQVSSSPGGSNLNVTHSVFGQGTLEAVHPSESKSVVNFGWGTAYIQSAELKEYTDYNADCLSGLGISICALIAFAFAHDCFGWPVWQVVRDIIVPATRDLRCRYGDLPEFCGLGMFGKATVFMSHCWAATFGDLIGAACQGGRTDRVVWIDIFAVRQWPGNVADLNFRGVIQRCKAMIVSVSPVEGMMMRHREFPNGWSYYPVDKAKEFFSSETGIVAKTILPFCRLWCVVEIVTAIDNKKSILVKSGKLIKTNDEICEYGSQGNLETKHMMNMMTNLKCLIDIETSECAIQADFDREMIVVRQIGVTHVNSLIKGVVNGAYNAIMMNISEIDTALSGEYGLLLNMKIYSLSNEKEMKLAQSVLRVAISGNHVEIVHILLERWIEEEGGSGSAIPGNNEDTLYLKGDEKERKEVEDKPKKKRLKWLCHMIVDSHSIMQAISNGCTEIVRMFLDVEGMNKEDLNKEDLLSFACENGRLKNSEKGHIEIVKMLLNTIGIDVNKGNDYGNPLFYACRNGHLEVVKVLLNAQGIDINKHCCMVSPPIFIAKENNHIEIVQLLHTAGALHLINDSIQWAATHGHTQILKMFLEVEGADVNEGDALRKACDTGQLEAVKVLLNVEGIDINKEGGSSWDKKAPLDIATDKNHNEIIHLLESAGAKHSLLWASEGGHTEIVRMLVGMEGVDVNKEAFGSTPLCSACENGHLEVVKVLLNAQGIDINKHRPIFFAQENNRIEIVQLLHNAGALHSIDHSIQWAAREGHAQILKMFLEVEGVDVNAQLKESRWKCAKSERTPLFWACENCHFEVVKVLLTAKGIDVNKKGGCYEESPLEIAQKKKNKEIVQLLQSAGAE